MRMTVIERVCGYLGLIDCEVYGHEESNYSLHLHTVKGGRPLRRVYFILTFGKFHLPWWLYAQHNRTGDVVKLNPDVQTPKLIVKNKLWYELMELIREGDND